MTNIDSEHPNMLHVVIPVPYNDITVSHDGRYANVGVYMQETNDKFRQACIQRRQQSGCLHLPRRKERPEEYPEVSREIAQVPPVY